MSDHRGDGCGIVFVSFVLLTIGLACEGEGCYVAAAGFCICGVVVMLTLLGRPQ